MKLPSPTARLTFRSFSLDDLSLVHRLVGDAAVLRYLTGPPLPLDRVGPDVLEPLVAEARRMPGYGRIAVERRDLAGEAAFVGWVSLRPRVTGDRPILQWPCGEPGDPVAELGFRLVATSWGQGFATEAARAAVEHALRLGTAQVVATTMSVNTGSRRVLERLGFHHTRTVHVAWDNPNAGVEQGEAEYRLGPDDPLG